MKCTTLTLSVFLAGSCHLMAAETAAPAEGADVAPVAVEEAAPKTQADVHLYNAEILMEQGDNEQALIELATLVVLFPNDKIVADVELKIANLYIKLGRLGPAGVTVRQIQSLHEGTDAAAAAKLLEPKIEELKKAKKLKKEESEGNVK